MKKLFFLGTSAAVSSPYRDNTALALKTEKELFLIDCPGSPVQKLSKCGLNFRRISCVILTHTHPDHLYGLPSLLHSMSGMKKSLKILGTAETLKLTKNLILLFRFNRRKYPSLEYLRVTRNSRLTFPSSHLFIRAFKTRHIKSSFGLKFIFRDMGIAYTGDTAYSETAIPEITGCDYLIHDCLAPSRFKKRVPGLDKEHTSSLLLGKIAGRARPGCLIPIHFSTELDFREDEIKTEIRKNFNGRIIIPEDLDWIGLTPQRSF